MTGRRPRGAHRDILRRRVLVLAQILYALMPLDHDLGGGARADLLCYVMLCSTTTITSRRSTKTVSVSAVPSTHEASTETRAHALSVNAEFQRLGTAVANCCMYAARFVSF